MNRLFGTDGIRGVADTFPLDLTTVAAIGSSLAHRYTEELGRSPKFLTGRDTRESGSRLEAALHAGAREAGASIESAGIITTPGVAYLTREFNFDAGIVISASHNPFEDNGIKIFLPSGQKLDERTEIAIESDIRDGKDAVDVSSLASVANATQVDKFHAAYVDHLSGAFADLDLRHMKIAVDCAHGAASDFGPTVLRTLGADVIAINDQPNGRNIN